MATYVLVPGAWLGGWAWQDVAARLRAQGHEVYPVTLTGLGERMHLARPEIDLETHITDVVNTITVNDLDQVILAGHSYAGIVITGAADRIPERLAQLVFVDSAPLQNGMAMVDVYPPEAVAGMQEAVDRFGEGWRFPFPGITGLAENASLAGISDEQRRVMEAKADAQPWRTYTQSLRLEHASDTPPYRQVMIACDDMRGLIEAGVPEIMPMTLPPWQAIHLRTGHWPMFSAPEELAEVLDGLVEE